MRELRNVVEFAVNMCEDDLITDRHLPKCLANKEVIEKKIDEPLDKIMRGAECKAIIIMLEHNGSSLDTKRVVAKKLGISLASLYK
ncbi:MAG: hypothetical protein HPY50_05130 [Firmicutes bacterium]|nr:hypothetical protein [Bacillota bacterium]